MKAFIISRQRSCRAGTPPRWQSNKHQLWLTDAMAVHPQNFTPGKLRTFDFAITGTTYQLKAYWCATRMPAASSRLIWRVYSGVQDSAQSQRHRSAFFGWRNNTKATGAIRVKLQSSGLMEHRLTLIFNFKYCTTGPWLIEDFMSFTWIPPIINNFKDSS